MKIRLMAEGQDTSRCRSESHAESGSGGQLGVGESASRRQHQENQRRENRRHDNGNHAPAVEPFPASSAEAMVFAGFYPVEGHEYPERATRSRSCG